MVDSKRFPSSTDVDQKVCDELNWTRDTVTHYLTYEEKPDRLIVKERRWIPPSEGRFKVMKLLKNHFKAERLPDAGNGRMRWKIEKQERRKAEAPQTKESNPVNKIHLGELQPAKTIIAKPSQLIYDRFSPRKTIKKRVQRMGEAIDSEGVEAVPNPKATWNFGLKGVEPPPSEQSYWLFDGQATAKALEERFPQFKVDFYDITEEEADFLAMRLNQVHGDPVEPIDEARHLKKMMEKYGYVSQSELLKTLEEKYGFKRSQPWLSQRFGLLEPSEDVITRVITLWNGEKIEVPYTENPYACFLCTLGTNTPIFKQRRPICPTCIGKPDFERRLEDKLKEMAPPPTKTETKEYKPPDDRPWKEKLKVDPSNFELRVERRGQTRKLPMGERHGLITLPFEFGDRTWYLPKGIMVWRANGVVHKGKEDKADRICQALRVLGVRVVETWYERDCDKAADEALDKIEKNLKEMGWNGK